MKVLFLGAGEKCGTTSSMTAVASFLAMYAGGRCFCMQHKNGGGDLELFFESCERRSMLHEDSTYYVLDGMDYLIWQEQHHALDWKSFEESMIPLLDQRLFYLPGGKREKPGLYPKKTGEIQQKIVSAMEQYADMLFIDIGHEMDDFSEELLRTAEVVVVTFSDDRKEFERFFGKPFHCRGRLIFLLGNYSDDQVYNMANLSRLYRMDLENTCRIPANNFFGNACARGKVHQFIRKNYVNRGGHRCDQFMREVEHLAGMILEVAHGGK